MDKNVTEYLNTKGLSISTRSMYIRFIELIQNDINLSEMTTEQFRIWLNKPSWGDNYRWVAYHAIRGYVSWCYGEAHPALSLRIKRGKSKRQRSLKKDQVKGLISSFPNTDMGIRNLAICSLLVDTGLRASEICALQTGDLDLENRRLMVLIKGGDWGDGVYSNTTRQALIRWLIVRKRIAKAGVHNVFVGIGGTTPGKKMTVPGLRCVIHAWAEYHVSTHDFRRTFAELSVKRGAPTRLVQLAGRWKKIDMVVHYTRNLEASDFEKYFPMDDL